MIVYKTRSEAMRNCRSDETYRKVEGGWAVMTWSEYNTWRDQK